MNSLCLFNCPYCTNLDWCAPDDQTLVYLLAHQVEGGRPPREERQHGRALHVQGGKFKQEGQGRRQAERRRGGAAGPVVLVGRPQPGAAPGQEPLAGAEEQAEEKR